MRKLLVLSLLFAFSVQSVLAKIIKSNVICTVLTEVQKHKGKRVLTAFDLDETLIIPNNNNHRGGDMWLQARVNNAVSKGVPVGLAWDLMLPMYFEIQKDPNFSVRLIEGIESFNVVQALQKESERVIGLTARSFPIEDDTIRLLEATGISFVHSGYFNALPTQEKVFMFDGVPGGFKHGIFFAGPGDKGKSLMALFATCEYRPEVIVFVDDKLKNVQSVERAAEAAGIEFVGILYTRMDQVKTEYKLHPDLT
ncbi:MAG: FMN phosphatase YigB (HAD superfamily) [Alteromonas naphthalenivorans]|jgi:FMN phosphatase YigB (HAD superfamily)